MDNKFVSFFFFPDTIKISFLIKVVEKQNDIKGINIGKYAQSATTSSFIPRKNFTSKHQRFKRKINFSTGFSGQYPSRITSSKYCG